MKVYKSSELHLIPDYESYKVGELNNIYYKNLVKILGEPTYIEPSEDEKVQLEWVIEFEGNYFSIYDWKIYDRNFTLNDLDVWSIGGNSDPKRLIDYIESKLI